MLKKEVRILGVSAPPKKMEAIPAIGVIFRGNLWLDGMLTCFLKPNRRDYLSDLARAIIRSKQYSQLRAVILSREQLVPGETLDVTDLADRINLPVISIIKEPRFQIRMNHSGRKRSNLTRYKVGIRGKQVTVLAAKISYEQAKQIFAVSCAKGHRIPEAVRVAELIAKHVSGQVFLHRKQATLKSNSLGLG